MFRTAVLSTIFLSCAVLAGTSLGEAQTLEPATDTPLPNGHFGGATAGASRGPASTVPTIPQSGID